MEKMREIIHQHRMRTLQGKDFEIRHLKNQAWLNGKVCQVIDAEPKHEDIFNPRVVCKLQIEKKLFSLKQTNLVDIGANIDDIVGTYCDEGHMFKKSNSDLGEPFVQKKLKELISWAEESSQNRPDQVYRLGLLQQYVRGEIAVIECKANPDYKEIGDLNNNEDKWFAYCLSAIRPGCVGDNFINFYKFNQCICDCDDQLFKRFRQFIVSGMCHCCQVYYIEKTHKENPGQHQDHNNVDVDVDAAVEVSEVAVDSVAVEDSVDLGSVVDIEEDVEDSEVIEEGSVVVAELGELEEDLGEEEEDSVEAMTEEKAALNSAICFAITSFQTTSSTTSSADFFSFSSSNNLLAGNSAFIANDQSYKSLVC